MVPTTSAAERVVAASLVVLLLLGVPSLIWAPEHLPLVWLGVLGLAVTSMAPRELVLAALIVAAEPERQPPLAAAAVALAVLSGLERLTLGRALAALVRFQAYAWIGARLRVAGELAVAAVIVAMAWQRLARAHAERSASPSIDPGDMTFGPAARDRPPLTSVFERRVIPRAAIAAPSWISPHHATLAGVGASALFAAGYALSRLDARWLFVSLAGLGIHFASDLAAPLSRRDQGRPSSPCHARMTSGALSVVTFAASFGLSPWVQLTSSLALACALLLVVVHSMICAYTSGSAPRSIAGIGPAEARSLAGLLTIVMLMHPDRRGSSSPTAFDVVLLAASGLALAAFLTRSVLEARRLERAEGLALAFRRRTDASDR
jgi:hypothetical protein